MQSLITEPQLETLERYRWARAHFEEPVPQPDVAYAGTRGSYAEAAALTFFGSSGRLLPHASFEDVFKSITGGGAHYGVVPIENSSTGSIDTVYDLLARFRCYIVGEEKVDVSHCLLALPGTAIADLREIYSHPQGFSQSRQFLSEHPGWKCIPWHNTAIAAEMVAGSGNRTYGAIASERAAQAHGLAILARDINSSSHNSTRFVVVAPHPEQRDGLDKISLAFHLPHESGALYHLLGIFDRYRLNLCKIESRPLPEANWEYRFFLDFIDARDPEAVDAAMEAVIAHTVSCQFLGWYAAR